MTYKAKAFSRSSKGRTLIANARAKGLAFRREVRELTATLNAFCPGQGPKDNSCSSAKGGKVQVDVKVDKKRLVRSPKLHRGSDRPDPMAPGPQSVKGVYFFDSKNSASAYGKVHSIGPVDKVLDATSDYGRRLLEDIRAKVHQARYDAQDKLDDDAEAGRITVDEAKAGKVAIRRRPEEADVSESLRRAGVRAVKETDHVYYLLNDLTANAFCPTGPGGGVDPTCSPKTSGGRLPDVKQMETDLKKYIEFKTARDAKLPEGHKLRVTGDKVLAQKVAELEEARKIRAPFDRWFGQSKAVDADGKPLVLYHGTTREFDQFQRPKSGRALWAADTETASSYAGDKGSVLPIYLSVQNPLVVDAKGNTWQHITFEGERLGADHIAEVAEKRGYDGLIIRNLRDHDTDDGGESATDHYAVFQGTQIKSAIGNRGTYDPADPIVTHAAKPKPKSPNPLRLDPSRTGRIRAAWERDMNGRFDRLKKAVYRLIVEEDAFGLKGTGLPTSNVFCSTGKGGGVDPSCGKSDVAFETDPDNGSITSDFTVGDHKYTFVAAKDIDDPNLWEVSFVLRKGKFGELGITGTGRPIEVMSKAIERLKKFVETTQPDKFFFSASEASRQRLYSKMAERLEVPGYERVPYKKYGKPAGYSSFKFTYRKVPLTNAWCPTGEGGGKDNSCSPKQGGGSWSFSKDKLPSHDSWKDLEADPAYVYHATNADNAADVQQDALMPHRPNYGTDQREWPDGSTASRSYFTPSPQTAWMFAPDHGNAALLRIKRNPRFKKESGTGDMYLERVKVPPSAIEILTIDGWKPLKAKPSRPTVNRLLQILNGDCGTGAGGFKPGNTCGKGGGSQDSVGEAKWAKGGVVYHSTSKAAAKSIEKDGIDEDSLNRRDSGFFGEGFYASREPQDFYGKSLVEIELSKDAKILDVGSLSPSSPEVWHDRFISSLRRRILKHRPDFPNERMAQEIAVVTPGDPQFDHIEYAQEVRRFAHSDGFHGAAFSNGQETVIWDKAAISSASHVGGLKTARKLREKHREVTGNAQGLGQPTTVNAFCPTGEGGGVDPTCSPRLSFPKTWHSAAKVRRVVEALQEERQEQLLVIGGAAYSVYTGIPAKDIDAVVRGMDQFDEDDLAAYGNLDRDGVSVTLLADDEVSTEHGSFDPSRLKESDLVNVRGITVPKPEILLGLGKGGDENSDKKAAALIKKMGWTLEHVRQVPTFDGKMAFIEGWELLHGPKSDEEWQDLIHNRLIANAGRWAFLTMPKRLEEFVKWFKVQALATILGTTHPDNLPTDAEPGESWLARYIRDAYSNGLSRAYDDVTRPTGIIRMGTEAGKAYQAGGKLEFMRQAFGGPPSLERMKLIASRTFDDLNGITTDLSNKISQQLVEGMVQGKSPLEVGRKLNKMVDGYKNRGKAIAQTEVLRAHNQGALQGMRALGVDKVGAQVEWATSGLGTTKLGNPSPCHLCAELQGVVLTLDEAEGLLPRHPYCLPGDSLVLSRSGITATSERWYDGDLVVIRTASGRELSCTPNHPVLTDLGWVPANRLDVGSHVVCDGGREWEPIVGHDDDQLVPARIEDVARSFFKPGEVTTTEVPLAAPDFHGDALDGDVAVVRTYRQLPDSLQAPTDEQVVQLQFDGGRMGARTVLPGNGTEAEFVEGSGSASGGIMGVDDLSSSLLGGHSAPPDQVGFMGGSSGNTVCLEDSAYSPSGHTVSTGKSGFGLSGEVGSNDPVSVSGQLAGSTDRSVLRTKNPGDDLASDSELASQLAGGSAGPVFLDEVVSVFIEQFVGHVYNLQTVKGYYSANGIITHNCRCAWTPANVGESTTGQLRTKSKIQKAVEDSIRAEMPKRKKRSLAEQKRLSSWAGADLKVKAKRPKAFTLGGRGK